MGGLEHVVSLATVVGVAGDIYINSRVVTIMLGGGCHAGIEGGGLWVVYVLYCMISFILARLGGARMSVR